MRRTQVIRAAGVALSLVAALAALAPPAAATTISVDCAHTDLQQKIDSATGGATLAIKGTCVGNFVIAKNLTLKGSPTATLDGGTVDRALTITGSHTVHLAGLEITGGYRDDDVQAKGGGIFAGGGILTLDKVSVYGNVALSGGTSVAGGQAQGGGIYLASGVLRVTDSKITDNWAISISVFPVVALGGGINTSGTLSVLRSSVRSNHAVGKSSGDYATAGGGGIYQGHGPLTVASSHIDGNGATSHGESLGNASASIGGGLLIANGTMFSMTDSTVSGNRLIAVEDGSDQEADAIGGAISAHVAKGTASDSAFLGNTITGVASEGPAIPRGGALALVIGQSFSLTRSRIVGSVESSDARLNGEGYGGGIWFQGGLSVISSTVSSNTIRAHGQDQFGEARGGGIRGDSGTLTLRSSTVDGNRLLVSSDSADSTAAGGGISINGGLAMSSSTVSRNVASAGVEGRAGGLTLSGSTTDSIVNSTIASNLAFGFTSSAGGVETDANALNITNTTVARNSAGTGGGLLVTGGTAKLEATIVARNTAPHSSDCKGSISSLGHNLIGKTLGCAGFTLIASDKRNVDAKLGLLAANGGPTQTLALMTGSPALNVIPSAQCAVATDQRGVKRPQGPRCDIGSFERAP
ncbi:MAG: choice-of-anchor Q domain-containing protein [Actinomycetota bacterium]